MLQEIVYLHTYFAMHYYFNIGYFKVQCKEFIMGTRPHVIVGGVWGSKGLERGGEGSDKSHYGALMEVNNQSLQRNLDRPRGGAVEKSMKYC